MINKEKEKRLKLNPRAELVTWVMILVCFLTWCIISISPVSSLCREVVFQETGAKLSYESEPDKLVLQLSYQGGMVDDSDRHFVRVFGDGKVLIHYPRYMKKAGDYSLQLTDNELKELLSNFADKDVLTLDTQKLDMITSEAKKKIDPAKIPNGHGVTTVIEIRAESLTPPGVAQPTLRDIEQKISTRNLELNAQMLPDVPSVQKLANGVRKIEELTQRPNLKRIP